MQVVGLACFKALSADGISFAIPIDVAKDVMTQLKVRSFEIQAVSRYPSLCISGTFGVWATASLTGCKQVASAAASDAPCSSSYWAQVQCRYSPVLPRL